MPRSAAMGTLDDAADKTWTDVGGYVNGFESVFDPTGFFLPAEEILALDPLFQWILHGTREALRGIGHESESPRAGLVLGGLSFTYIGNGTLRGKRLAGRAGSRFLPEATPRSITWLCGHMHATGFRQDFPTHLAATGAGAWRRQLCP